MSEEHAERYEAFWARLTEEKHAQSYVDDLRKETDLRSTLEERLTFAESVHRALQVLYDALAATPSGRYDRKTRILHAPDDHSYWKLIALDDPVFGEPLEDVADECDDM